jgi:SAM-dependent methyltransferase
MPEHPDLARLRAEYAERAAHVDQSGRYSLFNPGQLFAIQQRQRAILKCLRRNGFYPLQEWRILELGCGSGGVLLETLIAGAAACHLHGVDLLLGRVQAAHQSLSNLPLTCADGQDLPYAAHSFDLAMQFTVFSSVLDDGVKRNLARELLRVTRPGGMIVWYDFWWNPTNPQTRGIRPAEIRRLFPDCAIEFHKITLAPPIARYVAPFAWSLAVFLESLGIFNTHYLAAICPKN